MLANSHVTNFNAISTKQKPKFNLSLKGYYREIRFSCVASEQVTMKQLVRKELHYALLYGSKPTE